MLTKIKFGVQSSEKEHELNAETRIQGKRLFALYLAP